MKTQLLSATIAALSIAKETGLLLTFNFGKMHIEGVSQAISISQETGAVSKAEPVTVNKTVDFDSVDIEKLKAAVLTSVDTDLFQLKTDDRELLICHQFKQVCTSVAFKALNTKCVSAGFISESERLELTRLNNADKFLSYLLPLVMCEGIVKRANSNAAATDYSQVIAEYGLTDVLTGVVIDVIRYSADAGLTCWLSSKDWKAIAPQRANVTGKVGYICNGAVQITLNDSTRTKENDEGDEVISHRQVRFSRVLA